jgi:hypothetical protein
MPCLDALPHPHSETKAVREGVISICDLTALIANPLLQGVVSTRDVSEIQDGLSTGVYPC